MFELSDKANERLANMPFLEYLKSMHERIESIQHHSKSNSAYEECRALALHIRSRIVKELRLSWEDFDMKIGRNLRLSEEKLDMYNFRDSDSKKAYRIKEFVDEYTYDLSNLIRAFERRKENPETSIEEDEI